MSSRSLEPVSSLPMTWVSVVGRPRTGHRRCESFARRRERNGRVDCERIVLHGGEDAICVALGLTQLLGVVFKGGVGAGGVF